MECHGSKAARFEQQHSAEGNPTMTREEAFARCPSDAYVEYYGNRWVIVPFKEVVQPAFFHCIPGHQPAQA